MSQPKITHIRRGPSRRALLRGGLALPFLASAFPRAAWGKTSAPRRVVWWMVPNGLLPDQFVPQQEIGALAAMPPILAGLESYRSRASLITGLDNMGAANSNVTGGHPASMACLLTDVDIDGLETVWAGISVDQVAAAAIGNETPFRSLQLGIKQPLGVHGTAADIYKRTLSYGAPDMPLPVLTDPTALFDMMFPGSANTGDAQKKIRKSIMSTVIERTRDLKPKLAPDHRRRLDEYLTGLEGLERRVKMMANMECEVPEALTPLPDFTSQTHQMSDMMVRALQCDYTRTITFMMGASANTAIHPHLGTTFSHHQASHSFKDDDEAYTQIRAIELWEMELFKDFLDKLSAVTDVDGNDLLTNTMVILCSELSDGESHDTRSLPLVVFGGESAGFTHGQFRDGLGASHSQLWLAALDFLGVEAASFGYATDRFTL